MSTSELSLTLLALLVGLSFAVVTPVLPLYYVTGSKKLNRIASARGK